MVYNSIKVLASLTVLITSQGLVIQIQTNNLTSSTINTSVVYLALNIFVTIYFRAILEDANEAVT